jgi:hypothetical protein
MVNRKTMGWLGGGVFNGLSALPFATSDCKPARARVRPTSTAAGELLNPVRAAFGATSGAPPPGTNGTAAASPTTTTAVELLTLRVLDQQGKSNQGGVKGGVEIPGLQAPMCCIHAFFKAVVPTGWTGLEMAYRFF